MVPSLELSIVVWSRYIALKLPWKIWENDVKEGTPFHTFLRIFFKNLKKFNVKLCFSFCTTFQEDLRQTCPDIRSLLFLYNKELHKKFTLVLIVSKRWHHSDKTKTGIAFDLQVILTCGVFLKAISFEDVLVEKIKLHAFSGVQYHSKGCDITKFCATVELWKFVLKNVLFHKMIDKSHINAGKIKIPKERSNCLCNLKFQ